MASEQPTVSVVIPCYNGSAFVASAIQSCLAQTYPFLEVLVVDDGSQDRTSEVVSSFDDSRVRLLVHECNRGLPAARNTGMRASRGEILALLDADDLFHPEKLESHVHFLGTHPEIGVSYNNRFEHNYSAETIREIYVPPQSVGLSDFIKGIPFAPSDMVIRRDWAFRVGLFDETLVNGGEDLDFPCRLLLAGCRFARVDRILNRRRHHTARYRKNLRERVEEAAVVLNRIVQDPRCPNAAASLYGIGFAHHALALAFHAFAQERTPEGREFVMRAVRGAPEVVSGKPCPLLRLFVNNSIADDSVDHKSLLRSIFTQLPDELGHLEGEFKWAVGRGYLVKATRALTWSRDGEARRYFKGAAEAGAELDEGFLRQVSHQLFHYEAEFGAEPTDRLLKELCEHLEQFSGRRRLRRLKSTVSSSRAFRSFRQRRYQKVVWEAMRAIENDPEQLFNRGVVSILARSIVHALLDPAVRKQSRGDSGQVEAR